MSADSPQHFKLQGSVPALVKTPIPVKGFGFTRRPPVLRHNGVLSQFDLKASEDED